MKEKRSTFVSPLKRQKIEKKENDHVPMNFRRNKRAEGDDNYTPSVPRNP